MRELITIDFNELSGEAICAGRLNEHLAQPMSVTPPTFMTDADYYLVVFEFNFSVVRSEQYTAAPFTFSIWQQLTQYSPMTIYVEGYKTDGTFIGISDAQKLTFKGPRASGDSVGADGTAYGLAIEVAANTAARHIPIEYTDDINADYTGCPFRYKSSAEIFDFSATLLPPQVSLKTGTLPKLSEMYADVDEAEKVHSVSINLIELSSLVWRVPNEEFASYKTVKITVEDGSDGYDTSDIGSDNIIIAVTDYTGSTSFTIIYVYLFENVLDDETQEILFLGGVLYEVNSSDNFTAVDENDWPVFTGYKTFDASWFDSSPEQPNLDLMSNWLDGNKPETLYIWSGTEYVEVDESSESIDISGKFDVSNIISTLLSDPQNYQLLGAGTLKELLDLKQPVGDYLVPADIEDISTSLTVVAYDGTRLKTTYAGVGTNTHTTTAAVEFGLPANVSGYVTEFVLLVKVDGDHAITFDSDVAWKGATPYIFGTSGTHLIYGYYDTLNTIWNLAGLLYGEA